jgi:hypothetical protein
LLDNTSYLGDSYPDKRNNKEQGKIMSCSIIAKRIVGGTNKYKVVLRR